MAGNACCGTGFGKLGRTGTVITGFGDTGAVVADCCAASIGKACCCLAERSLSRPHALAWAYSTLGRKMLVEAVKQFLDHRLHRLSRGPYAAAETVLLACLADPR